MKYGRKIILHLKSVAGPNSGFSTLCDLFKVCLLKFVGKQLAKSAPKLGKVHSGSTELHFPLSLGSSNRIPVPNNQNPKFKHFFKKNR